MTDWRTLGHIPLEVWVHELQRMESPILGEASTTWSACRPHTALALAMAFHETKYGTLFTVPSIDASFKNPLGLMRNGAFVRFSNWTAAFREWTDRVTSVTYAAGLYWRTTTLDDLIHVYAPEKYGNDEARYVAVVEERIAAYRLMSAGQEKPPMTTALVPVNKDFMLPVGASNHPTTLLDTSQGWVGITVHETGNYATTANARNQAAYVNSADGRSRQVAYHFTVDDHEICQILPLHTIGWHAGDGCDNYASDVGCFRTIGIEKCVANGADEAKTNANLAELIARIAAEDPAFDWGSGKTKGKFSLDHLYQHIWVSAEIPPHDCPYDIRHTTNGWTSLMTAVDAAAERIKGGTGVAQFQEGKTVAFPKPKTVHAVAGARSRKKATAASDVVRLYPPGTALKVTGYVEGQEVAQDDRWLIIRSSGPSNKARIHTSGVEEDV